VAALAFDGATALPAVVGVAGMGGLPSDFRIEE
jgi:hypothetical protein